MKKNNIGVLITIIILLIVFIPGAIYGTYMHFANGSLEENPNKEFYFEGKLYFYQGEELLGTYTCITDNCEYEKNAIEDSHEIEAYNKTASEIEVVSERYAFIRDDNKVKFVDIKTGKAIIDYQAVKNYSVGIENDYYLIKNNEGLWGMMQITNKVEIVIPFQYNYLALANSFTSDGKIAASNIVALDETGWKIIDTSNNVLASIADEIKEYSSYFIINTKNQVFDYNGNQILMGYTLDEIQLLDSLTIGLTSNNIYVIYNAKTNTIISTLFKEKNSNYNFKIENNTLIISANNAVIKTIALS